MSDLISFYLNEQPNADGRMLAEMWGYSIEELAHSHDVIQHLFPLQEPSNFNPDAPLLTQEDISLFNVNPQLKYNLLTSFHRFMKVFGLEYQEGQVKQVVERGIWKHFNHNWLRFTRILKSLKMLGLQEEAKAFFAFLENKVGEVDLMTYWKEAIE